MNQRKEENDRRNNFMINLHESMGPDRDQTRDPWICSQTRICSQTCYRLHYAARHKGICFSLSSLGIIKRHLVIKQEPFQHSYVCLYLEVLGLAKSHLITALFQMTMRTFQAEGENIDDELVVTAPTATAAYNIGGVTLHCTFLLPLDQTKSFATLSDDKRNTLRSKTSNLQLQIIDDFSMVGSNLFLQLHCRLCAINCSKNLLMVYQCWCSVTCTS